MAAPVLAYENLGLVQGGRWLFREIDLFIGQRDRLALIGRNGAGKTTLFKCLADFIETDEGKRTIVPGTHVILLEQDPPMAGYAALDDSRKSAVVIGLPHVDLLRMGESSGPPDRLVVCHAGNLRSLA